MPSASLAGDRRVVARDGIHIFHGRVGPVDDDGAGLHQLLPDVRAFFRALGAEARRHIRRIGGGVNALHRRNHAEPAKPRNVIAMNVLRVLHAPSKVLAVPVVLPEGLFIDVQHFAVGAVADRMQAQLIAMVDRQLRGDPRVLHSVSLPRPELVDQIGVRRQKPCAARSQRAVHRDLDRAHREVFVAVVDQPPARELLGASAAANHHPQPRLHPPIVHQPLEALDVVKRRTRRPGNW